MEDRQREKQRTEKTDELINRLKKNQDRGGWGRGKGKGGGEEEERKKMREGRKQKEEPKRLFLL